MPTMMTGAWTPLGALLTLLFTVFVVASLVWIVLRVSREQVRGDAPTSAIAVLEARLARGEIGVDDYRARRSAIEAGR